MAKIIGREKEIQTLAEAMKSNQHCKTGLTPSICLKTF